jgi:hypothetical protein
LEHEQTNLIAAIKAGYRDSPGLRAELEKVELQLESITTQANAGSEVKNVAMTEDQIREFVFQKAQDLRVVLQSDPIIAKQALLNHIQQLVLSPKKESGNAVFEVTGDVDLFAGEPRVVHSVSGTGHAMHYTLSFDGLQLKTRLSSGTRTGTPAPIQQAQKSRKSRISAQDNNETPHPTRSLSIEGDQPAATGSERRKTGFRKLLRELLETPKRIKDLYPIVLQRQPEDCPPIPCTHRKGVKSKSMEWQHEIQRELQTMAFNRDGFWHLAQ